MGNKPNILLIVSDDHGYADLSCRGVHPEVSTPNLDRLVASGMDFRNGYVSAPICSPSRAGMMAGAYQQRWGARWFDSSRFAPQPWRSMPEVLAEAGYRTGYFGKVHYGPDDYGARSCPDRHGFAESFYGLAALSMGRLHYLRHGEEEVTRAGEAAPVVGVQPMVENGERVSCHNHLTAEFSRRAQDFMRAGDTAADEPFFCMVAFNAVHNFAWQLPDEELDARGLPKHPDFDGEMNEYLDWYDGAISPNLPNGREFYLAQLELLDREVGHLLDTLEETGQRENTLVVYLTDNGGSTCNYGSNLPLRGTKYTLFEGGIRVPFVASWPGVIAPGSTSDSLVSSLDLLPTFAALAGVSLDPAVPVDGVSLTGVFADPARPVHDALHFDTGFQWAVRVPEAKLRYSQPGSPQAEYLRGVEHVDVGEGLSLSLFADGEGEAVERLAENPELAAQLEERHVAWRREVGLPLP
ncbi:sulfatase family protein [Dermabacteraceae bacterium P13128]